MNILVITRNAWDDKNSIGNTISNLFCAWEDAKFLNLYFREASPQNEVCTQYYQLSEKRLLKYFFRPSRMGRLFSTSSGGPVNGHAENSAMESRIVRFSHRHPGGLAIKTANCLWNTKRWITPQFREVIEHFSPDVVFTFAKSEPQYYQSVRWIKQNTNAKVVLFLVDDVAAYYRSLSPKTGRRLLQDFESLMGLADRVYAVTEELRREYRAYSHDIGLLQKGCFFTYPVKKTVDSPLSILYAGNLLFGRDKTLAAIVQSLRRINDGQVRVCLHVFTGTEISDKLCAQLDAGRTTILHGAQDYKRLQLQMSTSDLVLHMESFDEADKCAVRYSFSTKLTDCMQSGSGLLAVGPADLASIRFTKQLRGAFVVDRLSDLDAAFRSILSNPKALIESRDQIRAYARDHFEARDGSRRLRAEFVEIASRPDGNELIGRQ